MPDYKGTERATIAATPQECFDALVDYERLPEWQPVLRQITVVERDEQGRGTVVDYELDAKVKTVRYRLRLDYDEPHTISSEYLDGDFRNFSAQWRFADADNGRTDVSLSVEIDPGRFVPGPVRGLIRDAVMTRALKDLRAHMESGRVTS